jgi:hypothetical protein
MGSADAQARTARRSMPATIVGATRIVRREEVGSFVYDLDSSPNGTLAVARVAPSGENARLMSS